MKNETTPTIKPLTSKKTPIGIYILGILATLGGAAMLLLWLSAIIKSTGLSEPRLLSSTFILGVLSLSSGIGMLKGKKWGWWLGALYFLYAIARSINVVILIPNIIESYNISESEITKHVGRIITNSLVLLYFFKPNVIKHFKVQDLKVWKKLVILAGLIIVISIIGNLLTFLFSLFY